MDAELFLLAVQAAETVEREKGIGTLSEGLIHSAIKYYYQPDPRLHEMKVCGCVCDALADRVALGKTVIEVQAASFKYLSHKLARYFADGGCELKQEISFDEIVSSGVKESAFPGSVTVIYPTESAKQIVWIDPVSGEMKEGAKRKNTFAPCRALWELYSLRKYIGASGFKFVILGIDVIEKRLLCGKRSADGKKGSRRLERIPLALKEEILLCERSDYARLLPQGLGEGFTAAEFGRLAKLRGKRAWGALSMLMELGVLSREKVGRGYLYYLK